MTIQTLDQLREQVQIHHLDRLEEDILKLAKPCARIISTRVDSMDAIPLGASRLGGLPDLPPDYQWKNHRGIPLTFIGQFRLSEIAPMDVEGILPPTGWLYFFYESTEQPWGSDQTERTAWDVHYLPDESAPLKRTSHPVMDVRYGPVEALPSNRVEILQGISLPDSFSSRCTLNFQNDTERDGYWELVATISDKDTTSVYQFLGYPYLIQTDVEEYADIGSQSISLDQRFPFANVDSSRWQFLFQIGSDPYPQRYLDKYWGDGGKLYICIPKASLAQRRFEDSWLTLQCY
jgi:uncharacterized protein YwqG